MRYLRGVSGSFALGSVVVALVGCRDAVPSRPSSAAPPAYDAAQMRAAITALRGTPLLLNFWATWCQPCIEELPDLAIAAQDLNARGGRTIAICCELLQPDRELATTLERAPRFFARRDIDLELWIYSERDAAALWRELGLAELPGGIPVTLAIDRNGEIVGSTVGRATSARLLELAAAADSK